MTRRAIVVGYGRAGQRHGRLLDELGIEWTATDSDTSKRSNKVRFEDLETALELSPFYDFAVICTPPDLHLSQIRQCLDAGLPVLCEKPLCGLGQLAEAEALLQHPNASKVMIGYNWRWNSRVRALKARKPVFALMNCTQHRELPPWGLLLDHCSHDLDIMRFILGKVEVCQALFSQNKSGQYWDIELSSGHIIERVTSYRCDREARLEYYLDDSAISPDGKVALEPEPEMFVDMWSAFLRGDYKPGLKDAIETQRLLEKCKELADGH